LIAPLPNSKGYDAIMVVVDSFTKMKVLLPTTTHITAKGVALLFCTQVFKWFGMPTKIISDRGPQFVSNFMKELYSLLSIQGVPSTAWHPQTDGQTEWANQEVEQYLRLFTNYCQDNWSDWIDIAEFTLNDQIHSAIKHSPFFLMYGFHPHNLSLAHTLDISTSPDTL
jgi:hypothetical protein